MPTITSDMVQKLRTVTGAGMMNCKRALADTGGDMDKAITLLREQGAASAAKRAGRITGDGLVTAHLRADGQAAVLFELNCETDFVARTDEFHGLLAELAQKAAAASPAWAGSDDVPRDRLQEVIQKLGENINPGRFTRFDREGAGTFSVYIHPSGGVGKVGVLLEMGFGKDDPALSQNETVKTLARDLAMQVAATNPRWVDKSQVPSEVTEQEKAIAVEQAKRDKKPEKIWDKIAQGKLQQFYTQFCLLQQPFVKDAGGKTSVAEVMSSASKTAGADLTVRRFKRYKVGEED